jgi:hypothetical protein
MEMTKQIKTGITFFLILFFSKNIYAQYLPKDGSKLNYNQIYFECPKIKNVDSYKIYLAYDSSENKQDFNSYLIKSKISNNSINKFDGLKFGKKYKWVVETLLKNKEILKSDIHYFSLYECPYSDTTKYKFGQYYSDNTQIEDGIVWLDQLHCAINRNLEVVWFLPPIIDDFMEEKQVRDFRVYSDGTISFMANEDAYHTTKDLNIIWKAPNQGKISGEKKENYHHSFEKLENGNYMILGNQYIELETVDQKDSTSKKIEFTTIIEYNINKEIVWSWKSIDHIPLDLLSNSESNSIYNTHCNSLSVSKNGSKILLGFRDISRIIEIEKVTGKIIRSMGKKLNKLDTLVFETDLFKFPHDAKYISDNVISILNNNDPKNGAISSLDLYFFPKNKKQTLKRIFYFKFDFDNITNGKSTKLGNAQFLSNKNILINQGAVNRIVEIDSKTKAPLWDVFITKKYPNSGWNIFPIYRIYFTKVL